MARKLKDEVGLVAAARPEAAPNTEGRAASKVSAAAAQWARERPGHDSAISFTNSMACPRCQPSSFGRGAPINTRGSEHR